MVKNNIILANKLLRLRYPPSDLGNKKNPLDELLYIIISLRTTEPSLQRTYRKFKNVFPKWENVLEASVKRIATALRNAGLFKQKAQNLKMILRKIKSDWKDISLKKLQRLSGGEMEKYLISLRGIGLKSARCIMMYSFRRKVFPVDSHCFRIIKRLGWIEPDSKYSKEVQNRIQYLIPPRLRYRLHVNLIQHGRRICLPAYPRCNICVINRLCNYYKSHKKSQVD